MSMAIVIGDDGRPWMTFAGGSDLFTNVVLSLSIEQGKFFADTSFGLRRRKRMKNTPATARLIRQDHEQALQWLLDTGRAVAIVVTVSQASRNRLKVAATVTGAQGNQVTYEQFVEVV